MYIWYMDRNVYFHEFSNIVSTYYSFYNGTFDFISPMVPNSHLDKDPWKQTYVALYTFWSNLLNYRGNKFPFKNKYSEYPLLNLIF